SIDLLNNNGSSIRGIRGGTWFDGPSYLSSSARYDDVDPTGKNLTVGFRVVSLSSAGGEVPEPSTMAIFGLGALGMAYRGRRRSES
ncbi:MAG: PEP-CTERM sorting domain-containing protein, partial [Planctomycetes bacterium]|nr:PEP-CTERM sorting domain-containing protein [Planctomycetota bacterium]